MAWPATIPALNLTDGYQENLGDASYRSQTDSGPGKTRPRPDAPNDQLSFSQVYDSSDVDDLVTYYGTTLNNGSATFTENHPRTGTSKTFRFVSPPQFAHISGPLYRATFTLEVMP